MSPGEGTLRQLAKGVYHRLHGQKVRLAILSLRQRLRGTSVVNDAGHRLHFDPGDLRGRKLFRFGGALDRDAIRLWKHLADDLDPTLVIDVGANYGEVVLSRHYPPGTAIHLVEANPMVAKYLKRNVAEAIPRARIHVAAASDHSGTVRLRLRSTFGAPYSGMASVELEDRSSTSLEVPAVRLEDEIEPGERLLFKIDVEGHELSVLRGMERLLVRRWVGMCELSNLSRRQIEELHTDFRVLRVDRESLETRPSEHHRPPGPRDIKDVVLLPPGEGPAP